MPKNLKIVIIDDNTDFLFTMETFLQRNGFEVHTAEDGQTGIDLIKKECPDLILLDIMMETLFSGFEVCKQGHLQGGRFVGFFVGNVSAFFAGVRIDTVKLAGANGAIRRPEEHELVVSLTDGRELPAGAVEEQRVLRSVNRSLRIP